MTFHALLPVRDEGDIIAESLEHMLGWADAIYVFDTGSVDSTWDIVNEYAGRDSRIKPLRRDHVYYSENMLRGWLFNEARKNMRDGDWFLRVDADEFHHVSPSDFVKTRLRAHETIVWHQYYDFCLLESEAAKLYSADATRKERGLPLVARRRWWRPSVYTEPRMCRYRDSMKWPASRSFPHNAGFVAVERLPIRHYPHRDPLQLHRRCALRSIMLQDTHVFSKYYTAPEDLHWSQSDWRKFVTPDDQSGLHMWKNDQDLPSLGLRNHIAPPHKRFAQLLLHKFFVRRLDRRRAGWSSENYPDNMPAEICTRLQRVLQEVH